MTERLIGYGYTNSSGVATMTKDASGNTISGYTGVGAGEMDFKARLHDDSSVQSTPYTVKDCTIVDTSTSENTIWYNQSNASFTYGSEYITLSENGGNAIGRLKSTNSLDKTNICVEFDLYQVDGATSNNVISFLSTTASAYGGSYSLGNLNLQKETWNHIKLVVDSDGYVTPNELTAQKKQLSFTTEKMLFGFLTNGDITSVRFKNFIVYPI